MQINTLRVVRVSSLNYILFILDLSLDRYLDIKDFNELHLC